MIEVTRENLNKPFSEEDSFSLKIIADRYLLKDNSKDPKHNDVVVAEFHIEKANGAGYNTIKEVAIVDSYDAETETAIVTLFTGGTDRGTQEEVKRKNIDVLIEPDGKAMKKRIAKALSGGDKWLRKELEKRTLDELIFGGRILTGAGTDEELTYFNCYVAPMIKDSRAGIADHRKIVMEIMSRGGGVGTNGSTLRPIGDIVKKVRGKSSGAVSWLDDLSNLTHKVSQGGSRRGAQMICLADFHPELINFIISKVQKPLEADLTIDGVKQTIKFGAYGNKTLEGANISVLFSDKFMKTLKEDGIWELRFPDVASYTKEEMEIYDEVWHEIGDPDLFHLQTGLKIKTHARIPAKDIANLFSVCMHGSAEPGAIFLERCNKMSNTWYFNPLIATNPCGEQPLAKWSVCNLGHVNLAHPNHVKWNEEEGRYIADIREIRKTTRVLTRALDNVIDATPYYFKENKDNQLNERRLGLGTMGIDELLKLEGLDYGTQEGRDRAEYIFREVTVEAYYESTLIAKEKGSFPAYREKQYLESGFMKFMAQEEPELIEAIKRYGIRNATLVTQAPTGTTGTMAQTSTGIEPFYAGTFWRSSRIGVTEQKAPVIQRMEAKGMDTSVLKYAGDYTAHQHLAFQAVAQKWCDSAISKTINAPRDTTVEGVQDLLEYAYDNGLKGFTVYVDGSRETQVLSTDNGSSEAAPEVSLEHYPAKTALAKAIVGLATEDGKPTKIVIDVEKLSDVLDTEGIANHLAHMIKTALEAHNSTDCSDCGAPLIYTEGCFKCEACGFSKCG